MVKYTCDRCKMSFDHKLIYDNHINRKIKCKKNNGSKTNRKLLEHMCEKCEKKFSRKDSLKRHYATCKVNKKTINNKNRNLKNTNNVRRMNNSKINNGINKNSGGININGDVKVVLLNYPPDKNIIMGALEEILDSNDNINISMIKKININENKPEHHNIYYPDIKSSHGEIFTENRWNTKKIDEILNIILESGTDILKKILNGIEEISDNETKERIKNCIDDYCNADARKKLKSHLKVLLYGGKDIIKKTRKITNNTTTCDNNDIDVNENIVSKRDFALYLLGKIKDDSEEHEIMRYTIKNAIEPHVLDVIIRLLCRVNFTNTDCTITNDSINKEIEKENEVYKLLSNISTGSDY